MVHQSTLFIRNQRNSTEIARFQKKIHEDSDKWDVIYNHNGIKVSAYTYNKLNPFSLKEDAIKWKVEVKCEHCRDSKEFNSECTGFSNDDKTLAFVCGCQRTNIIADFYYTKCPPTVPLAIVGGAAAVAGGVVVTTCSLGLAAPLGGALIGGGMSAVCEAGAALSTGECDGASLAANIAAGAAMGAFSGGVGALGESAIKNVGSGALKLGARAAIGAVASAGSKSIGETKDCATGNKEWSKFGQAKDGKGNYTAAATLTSWTTDVVAGAAGGAVCHANSNISKAMTGKGGLLKATTRTAVSTVAASATNAAGQGVAIATGNQKEFSTSRLVTTAVATATVCAAQEGAKNMRYRANGGKHAILKEKIDKTENDFIESEVQGDKVKAEEVKQALETLRKTDPATLDECNKAAVTKGNIGELSAQHQDAQSANGVASAEFEAVNSAYRTAPRKFNPDVHPPGQQTKAELKIARDSLYRSKLDAQANERIALDRLNLHNELYDNLPVSEFVPNDPKNLHALHSEHFKQFAADVNGAPGSRGPERFLFDRHSDGSFRPAGYTKDHNYAQTPAHGDSPYYGMEQQCHRDIKSHNNTAHFTAYTAVNNRK